MLKKIIESNIVTTLDLFNISGNIEHDVEMGGFREFFINSLIRPLIPYHFGIASGIIIDAYGHQSGQCDLIIFDKRLMPPIWEAEGRGIYPIDSVLAVIEVKSTLATKDFNAICSNAKKLSPNTTANPNGMRIARPGQLDDDRTIYPLVCIFAYTSEADFKDEWKRLVDKVDEVNAIYIKGITIMNKGVWAKIGGQIKKRESNDVKQNVIDFLILTLNQLETMANSRGKFRLEDWIKPSMEFQNT